MDLQKMASEFATAVLELVRNASLEELMDGSMMPILTVKQERQVAKSVHFARLYSAPVEEIEAALRTKKPGKPSPGTNVVATVTVKAAKAPQYKRKQAIMRSVRASLAKARAGKKKLSRAEVKKAFKLSAKKKEPLKKVVKRSHKKKVSR